MTDQRDKRLREIAYRLLNVVGPEFYQGQPGVRLTDPFLDERCDIVISRVDAILKLMQLSDYKDPEKILTEAIAARAECVQLKLELEQLKSSQSLAVGEATLEFMKVLKAIK